MITLGALALPGVGTFGAESDQEVLAVAGDTTLLMGDMRHLRSGEDREWSEFPESAVGKVIELDFQIPEEALPREGNWMLSLRQQDVKQIWTLTINEKPIGRLVRDENDLISDWSVPSPHLIAGKNRLRIAAKETQSTDDVRVGEMTLRRGSIERFRQQATIEVFIEDVHGRPLPGRVTLVDERGVLVPLGNRSNKDSAVREGVAYTGSGRASLKVAPGRYRVHVGRGFEYSVESDRVEIAAGEQTERTFVLRREVETEGWVACDTHVHTVTHSGHGDATIDERILTLAGEGIELPIATDHNTHVDYRPVADKLGMLSHFTPLIGNEVTTKRGHFNVFPVRDGAATPNHRVEGWDALFAEIRAVPNVRVVILNHGRDIHSGFRPLSPRHHLSLSGENLDGDNLGASAMTVVNSGAVQSDPLELYHDWCGLMNFGKRMTPVGCSDSHDVSRYIVGQGRTYVRCRDDSAGEIDLAKAVDAFAMGEVIVSYGLFVDLHLNERAGIGETYRPNDDESVVLQATVRSPSWVIPRSVHLYGNGREIFRKSISPLENHATDQTIRWSIPRSELPNDVWFSAVALGDGVSDPYWPTAKPYQPDSTEFLSTTFACSGAIFVDLDEELGYSSPRETAEGLIESYGDDRGKLLTELAHFDQAIITQAASLLFRNDGTDSALIEEAGQVGERLGAGFERYQRERRRSIRARVEATE